MTDPELWAEYRRLAEISRHIRITPRAWAIDEGLEFILDHIEQGTGASCSLRQIEDKIGNAAAKFRNRSRLTSLAAITEPVSVEGGDIEAIEARQRLQRCTEREQRILIAGAVGFSVAEIAIEHSAPTGSIKSWASRAKAKCAA